MSFCLHLYIRMYEADVYVCLSIRRLNGMHLNKSYVNQHLMPHTKRVDLLLTYTFVSGAGGVMRTHAKSTANNFCSAFLCVKVLQITQKFLLKIIFVSAVEAVCVCGNAQKSKLLFCGKQIPTSTSVKWIGMVEGIFNVDECCTAKKLVFRMQNHLLSTFVYHFTCCEFSIYLYIQVFYFYSVQFSMQIQIWFDFNFSVCEK